MPKITLNLSPLLMALRDEAERMGVSFPSLLTADLGRFRALAEVAAPLIDDWEWRLIAHVWDGIEAHDILTGHDGLPSPSRIIAEIETWADGGTEDDVLRAGRLSRRISGWPPLAVAAVLLRLREPQ